MSCQRFDPRCLTCNATACLSCADLLLNSVRRSGARSIDAPLPDDERTREFSRTFSFGSQDPGVFDEAEPYLVVLPPTGNSYGKYLNDSTKTCTQGANADASWACSSFPLSHRVCGHYGVFSFHSPLYEIAEAAGNITLTVRRSGGGVGTVAVEYDLEHITTTPDDVSSTAFYTSSQTLVFAEGVVELAFQLTIHDDFIFEGNETFRVWLRDPAASDPRATLGNQRSALVTIIDDDSDQTVAPKSYVIAPDSSLKLGGVAGDTLRFFIQSVLGSGVERRVSNTASTSDTFLFESYAMDVAFDDDNTEGYRKSQVRQLGTMTNNGNGTYTCTWNRMLAGNVTVAVYLIHAGGLLGEYYHDAWLGVYQPTLPERLPVIRRIDRHVNFTWGDGAVFAGASDYLSFRWSGWLKPMIASEITFSVSANDHVRLWVNDSLLLDRWDHHDAAPTVDAAATIAAAVDLSSFYCPIVLEYRELSGDARVQLYWSSASFAREVVPAANLYTAEQIQGSPFVNVPISPIPAASNRSSIGSTVREIVTSTPVLAGKEFVFQVLPRDLNGNAWRSREAAISDDSFAARLSLTVDLSLGGGLGASTSVDAVVIWDPRCLCFRASATPVRSGQYNLDVWVINRSNINSQLKLPGSPFPVRVLPADMSPAQSVISGVGIQANRVAGVATTVLLEARDAYKNRLYTGGLASQIKFRAFHTSVVGGQVTPVDGATVVGSVSDNGDGTYVLTYTPQLAGTCNVAIKLKDAHVNNSPYVVTVIANAPAAATTTASGVVLASASTNVQTSFQITTRDAWGNLVLQGGATFQVELTHPDKGSVSGTCVDLLNGRYTCSYVTKYTGDASIVKLRVALVGSGGGVADIAGSPFAVSVVAGPALGSLCIAEGTALVSAVAGVRTNFSVQIRDYFDNVKVNAGMEAITAVFTGPAPATSTVTAINAGVSTQYIGDGIYVVSYRLTTKGAYSLRVQVDGVDVHSSPFSVYTYPAEASPSTTIIDLVSPSTGTPFYAGELITARVITRDMFSNTLETGGYAFHFHSDATNAMTTPLADEANGQYLLTLQPKQARLHGFDPRVLLAGGFNATYLATPNATISSKADIKLERIDTAIAFDFDVHPPAFTNTMATFSIRWQGFLHPRYTEMYTFSVDVVGGVSVAINSRSALPADMWPSSSRGHGSGQAIALTGGDLVAIDVNYTKHSDLPTGAVALYWQSPSQPREAIPSSRLFTSWRIANNVPPLDVLPATPEPTAFTAVFAPSAVDGGLSSGEPDSVVRGMAGGKLTFTVTARDTFGNARRSGGDRLYVLFPELSSPSATSASSTTGSGAVYPSIVDIGNGSYTISFSPIWSGEFAMVVAASADASVPTTAGVDALDVYLRGSNIQHSPFTLLIAPNEATAVDSTTVGAGFALATAGVETCFVLQLRDLHGNCLLVASALPTVDTVRVKLVKGSLEVTSRVDVASDPSSTPWADLSVCYTATVTGIYRVLLSVDGGASFTEKTASLRVYPNAASAITSTLAGDGIASSISTGRFYTYQVTARDAWGNALETGGDQLAVELRGPQSVWGTVTDLLNGQYAVTYLVALPGDYELETRLASRQQPSGLSAVYFADTLSVDHAAVNIPVFRTIDPNIAFDWQSNQTMRGYPRIQWCGYLVPEFTEVYTLSLEVYPADSAAVYISGAPVIDAVNAEADSSSSPGAGVATLAAQVSFVGKRLHPILVEYHALPQRDASLSRLFLSWQSDSQPKQIVPSSAFVPAADEIPPRHRLVAT